MTKKVSVGYLLLAFLMAILFVMVGASYSAADIEGHTDGQSLQVRKHARETVRTGPTIRSIEQPSDPANRTDNSSWSCNANPHQSYDDSFMNNGICRNRAERFAPAMEDRECDPSVQPEMWVYPVVQAPDLAPNDQQLEIVSEPVEIVITSSDLLELIPASPQMLMDRGPFGLKNAHTNFYASNHRPQTVTRTMFDQEVTITATPVEYRWDYGAGETLVTDVPGHPVEVFNTETETSHQYTDTGLYTVALTTVFEGTYQVDGGATQTVSSPVTQVADPVEIRIWRAVTRNVDQTCLQNPSAWGC